VSIFSPCFGGDYPNIVVTGRGLVARISYLDRVMSTQGAHYQALKKLCEEKVL